MSAPARKLQRHHAVLNALSALSPRRHGVSRHAHIGVFLFWGLGDAVLTTPFLRALRKAYPDAHIEALGKPWLRDLFADEGLFDTYRTLVAPWSSHSRKYHVWSRDWRAFSRTSRDLAKTRFDLLVSLRPDPRETVLARYLSTTEFAGYASAGGKGWINVDLGRDVIDEPQTYRGMLAAQAAAALINELPDSIPRLTPPEPVDIAARLGAAGYRGGPVLGISFGAAHPLRRWSGERIADTLKQLQRQPGAYLLIESDDAPRVEVPDHVPTLRWRGSMRELKQALAATDILLCADSGVMHVGAALGCRTVSVFGAGSIGRFAPRGAQHSMYAVEPMPCRPCYDACIYASPLCMDRIETSSVSTLVDRALSAVPEGRAAHLLHSTKSPA